jgi:pimeloyl-ACP methyl ester carboxylesterase
MKDRRPLSEVGRSPEFSSTSRVITGLTSDGLPIEAFVKFADEPQRLLCLLPSAQPRSAAPQVPFFPRWSWASGFDDWDVVSLSDPMLHAAPALHASWFVSATTDITKELGEFLKDFCLRRGIPVNRVTLYGSSMGGFGALMIASSLPGSRAVAEVPQLNLLEYPDPQALTDVERLALDGTTLKHIEHQSPEKVNVIARFQHSDYIPPLSIITNRADSAHPEALDFLAALNAMAPTVSKVGPTSLFQTPRPEGHAVQPTPFMIETLKSLSQLPCDIVDGRPVAVQGADAVPLPDWDVSDSAGWESRPLVEAVTWVESPGSGEVDIEFEISNSGAESQKGIVLCIAAADPDSEAMNRAGFRFSTYRGIGYFKYLRVPSGTSQIRESITLADESDIRGFGLATWDLQEPQVANLKIAYRG